MARPRRHGRRHNAAVAPSDRRLRFEPLEDRRLLSITVNTLVDEADGSIVDGDISLRDAIAASPAGGVIDFSVTGTISLALGEVIVQDRIIQGPGAGLLTIDAHEASRVFRTRGTTTLADMTITGGNGGEWGGGILNEPVFGNEGHLTVINSVVTGNKAFRGGGIYGGGDIGAYGSVTVLNSTVSGNTAVRDGGSYNYSTTGNGGGIFGGFSDVTVDRSTISGNTAELYGGGIWGLATISNSTVSGNKAESGGGAYLLGNSTVANSTISGNDFGGIVTSGIVANSTIVGNELGYGVTGGATLLNSIVAGNFGEPPSIPGGDLGTINTGASRNNLIADAAHSGGLVDGVNGNIVGVVDPGLGPLANNGGPTKTHALFSFSPAVNAGDNSLVPNDPATGLPFTTDQTGAARIFVGGTVDIGAVEHQGTPSPSTIVNTATDDVASNALTSLREAIAFAQQLGGAVTFDPTVFATPQTVPLVHGRLTLDGATIVGPGAGQATVDAGGASQVFINRGVTHISGLTFTGGINGIGIGAIVNFSDGTLTIQDSVISGNAASGIYNYGTLVVSGSTISDNHTTGVGGGIWVDILESAPRITTIVNSTISGNSASKGGGIYGSGTVTIRNSTISGNSSSGAGGGIDQTDGSLTIYNSIVAGNLVAGAPNDILSEPDPASSYNLIGDAGSAGDLTNGVNGNIVGVDPALVLGPLADNGGPTPTHALLPGSPAIDAGDPTAVAGVGTVPQFDQRGFAFSRVIDGDGTGPPRIDIGAFEVHTLPPATPALFGDYNLNGVVDAADYVAWRDTLGAGPLPAFSNADGEGDGTIDSDDYGVWTTNFGNTLGGGTSGEERAASAMDAAFAQFEGPRFSSKLHQASIFGPLSTATDDDSLLLLATSFAESDRDDDDGALMVVYDGEDDISNDDSALDELSMASLLPDWP